MNTVLSENFRKYRLAVGMTQEQVAASLNINAQTVSRWECGTTLPDILTENYEEGYRAFLHAIRIWPNNWPLYIHGGEICQALKKYDEAFGYWDKAGKIGTYFHDEVYCKAYCYEDMGEFDKAARILFDLADTLRREHYDVEAEMAEEDARIMKGKTII